MNRLIVTLATLLAALNAAAVELPAKKVLTLEAAKQVAAAAAAEAQPLASIDLATRDGVVLIRGAWRYRDADIVSVEFTAAGPDGQPTGAPVMTHDITPRAGGRDFDDSAWEVIAPETLTARRGNGRLSFDWYRIRITIPARIGGVDPRGSSAVFETSVDDSVFRQPSGYTGDDIAAYRQPGSNGLTLNAQVRLAIDQHGNRRVIRLGADGRETVLAARYQGNRLNSPNDLVYRSDGALYFADPYFGLPKFEQDPRKELPFSGVFRVKDGVVELLTQELKGPNGIAFSPDERYLYVGDWDEQHKVVMRYPVRADGRLEAGEVFFDMTDAPGEDAIDGIKVDVAGNLYVSGPGGLWILSPAGRHLGTVHPPRHPHNIAWGDADGRTLYLCAGSTLYRMPLNTTGIRP